MSNLNRITGEIPAYNHQYNYDYLQSYPARPDWISITVPDQVLSLREILDRYSKGHSIPNIAQPTANTPLDLSDLDHMDKFDKLALSRKAANDAAFLEGQLGAVRAKKAKKDRDARFDQAVTDRVNDELKKQQNNG